MAEPSAIGPYRILAPLGRGGMGVVYRARHIGSERAVALKTVSVPTPRWLESIRREIHALTQIRHPGVVRIVDHGVDQGLPWYAMDFLEGATLTQFARRIWSPFRTPSGPPVGPTEQVSATAGASADMAEPVTAKSLRTIESRPRSSGPIPAAAGELRTVLRIMRRVSATLAFLHGEGFVNCDLKPDNILLRDGHPVLIDFGLTAHQPGRSGREALDPQHGASGTPPYMSPEQFRGDLVDARSDLYAFGCILYELVTGTPPFAGGPSSVRDGHLFHAPVPPSELVTDVPPELERVVLKLLDKDLAARFGYADEVATLLAGLGDDVHRLPDFPPPRSYLYRPRLVGRDELMEQLVARRRLAAEGCGSFVLLAGESGVGKTRVAMEVTRVTPFARMQTVTSESSALPSEGSGGASPLQAARPLLRAVADRCLEGGPEVTERLLGDRRSVLAQYEPLLAQVPAKAAMPPPMPLAVDASRRRLFKYLGETLSAMALEEPVLWVIDDLGWADELSLSFLQSLTEDYLQSTPAFILCTYRSEEATEAVSAIARLAHVTHVTLPRLGQEAVSTMVGDMLALGAPKDGFVEFVTRQAEGNPFFVAEYLRGAMNERVLHRDSRHQWQMGETSRGGAQNYASLPLPGSLRELIEQRLRRLTPAGQQAGLAAAVLGREVDVDVLREVAALSDETAVGAIDELVRRQVLEPMDDGRVRFAHDKLREVAYAHAPVERLVQLHARAGRAIETRWSDRPDANQQWAALGHHFAAAKMAEPAAKYLKLAADHARATYANADAIRLYREAIGQVEEMLLALSGEAARWEEVLRELHESVADLLALGPERDKARSAYEVAMSRTGDNDRATRARLSRKIGKSWEMQHQPDQALRFYGTALTILGSCQTNGASDRSTTAALQEWIQVHIDRMWVYYYVGRLPEMSAIIETLEPIVEKHGSPGQRAQFFQKRSLFNFRRDLYFSTEETVHFARTSLDACRQDGCLSDLPMAQFVYGFALLHQFRLRDADRELRSALALAERAGDAPLRARCLTYVTVAARMRGMAAETRDLVEQSSRVAPEASTKEYVAAAYANRAWLSRREGDLVGTDTLGRQALDMWRSLSALFPFQWLALIPLIEVGLQREDIAGCIELAEALLAPGQQCLPGAAADAFALAIAGWRAGEHASARFALERGLKRLEGTGYR